MEKVGSQGCQLPRSVMIWAAVCVCIFWSANGLSAAGISPDTDQDEEDKTLAWGPFEVRSAFGLSAVFVDVSGSEETYRTHYNYQTGFNLSEFLLELNSEEQGLSWLDYLKLDGEGFGGAHPYERANLFFGKRGLYEFRGRYWKQDYFFNLPTFAMGDHTDDSRRRVTDLNLRLFPHRRIVVDLGYVRNYRYGTAFTSELKYQNLVELRSPRRSLTQDFRIGASFDLGTLQTSVSQNFRKFKDDTSQDENRLLDEGTLPQLDASLPVRLSVPSTQVMARWAPSHLISIDGKYMYSDGHVEAGRSQFTALKLTEGFTLEEMIRASSISDRPEHLADITATFDLTDRLVFSNVFDIRKFEIGGEYFQEMVLGNPATGSITLPQEAFSSFEYQTIRNRPEVEFLINPSVSFFGGYQYENRRVEHEQERITGVEGLRQTTVTHSGFGGVSWRPYSGSRVFVEFEGGAADEAFHQTEARDFTRLRFSSNFPLSGGWSVAPHLVFANHSNETVQSSFDADQFQAGVAAYYQDPDGRFDIEAGYTLFDLDTLTDIRFFFLGDPSEGVSDYRTQLHYLHTRVSIPVGNRVRARMGYQLLSDPEKSSFPLDRHVGEAGIQVTLGSGWSALANWYYVSYNESFEEIQDYKANRLALTLRWGF